MSWKHSRKCVSMALERLLECHDLGLKVTTFTISLLKIPGYMATAPQKQSQPCCQKNQQAYYALCIHTGVKGVESSLLIHSVSLSARAHTERLSA